MRVLEELDETKPITLTLSSFGGESYGALALIEFMERVRTPIRTVALGYVMSAGALIAACGDPGLRESYPNTRYMYHQIWMPGVDRKETDMSIDLKEIQTLKEIFSHHIRRKSGLAKKEAMSLFSYEDKYLTPHEVKRLGLVDTIYRSRHKSF